MWRSRLEQSGSIERGRWAARSEVKALVTPTITWRMMQIAAEPRQRIDPDHSLEPDEDGTKEVRQFTLPFYVTGKFGLFCHRNE
jgi:hypothetical protein